MGKTIKALGLVLLGLSFLIVVGPPLILSQIGKHYDYALDRDQHLTECASFFENEQRYDFSTVIWAAEGDCKKPINGSGRSPYYIYTTHITNTANGPSTMNINFVKIPHRENLKGVNVEIVKDSISVILSTPTGETISPDKSNFYMFGKDEHKFEQQYSQKLPEQLIETITLELLVNGERIKINKKYPIELHLHYDFWDQLMGV